MRRMTIRVPRAMRHPGVAAIACGVLASPVAAQDAPAAPSRTHRVGPLAVAPTVTLHDVGVDSNVYNTVTPVSDFTVTFTPAITASTQFGRTGVTLRSTTDLVYFARQTSERSVNQAVSGGVRAGIRRIALTAAASYLNTRQRPTEEIDARARRIAVSAEAGAEVSLTPKLAAGIKFGQSRTKFDADAVFDGSFLAHELNRTSRTTAASVRYAVTRLTTVSLSGSATRTEFVKVPGRDADTREVLAGIDLHPRALISGSASFGYQHFRPRGSDLPELRGAIGAGVLSFRLGSAASMSLEGGRSIDYSYFEDQPYYVRQGYGGSLRRQLTPVWDVQLAGSQFTHRYRRALGFEDERARQAGRDRMLQVAVTTGFRAGPATRVTFSVSYFDRRSTFLNRSFDGVRAGTAVSYAF